MAFMCDDVYCASHNADTHVLPRIADLAVDLALLVTLIRAFQASKQVSRVVTDALDETSRHFIRHHCSCSSGTACMQQDRCL
jgi:hypothetical protein